MRNSLTTRKHEDKPETQGCTPEIRHKNNRGRKKKKKQGHN